VWIVPWTYRGASQTGDSDDLDVSRDRYLTAAELDTIREIANSGFDPSVIRRHRTIGRPAVRRFLEGLVEKGFLRPEQLPRSARGKR